MRDYKRGLRVVYDMFERVSLVLAGMSAAMFAMYYRADSTRGAVLTLMCTLLMVGASRYCHKLSNQVRKEVEQ